jgi:hypothetical protein
VARVSMLEDEGESWYGGKDRWPGASSLGCWSGPPGWSRSPADCVVGGLRSQMETSGRFHALNSDDGEAQVVSGASDLVRPSGAARNEVLGTP